VDEREIIARADANYFEAMRAIIASNDGGDVRECDGVLILASGLPVAWFNIAFVTRPPHAHDAAIRGAINYFDAHKLPFLFRMREGVDPAFEQAAAGAGLPYSDTVPGLVLHPVPDPPAALAALDIRTVRDAQTLGDHVRVVADSFSMPLEMAQRFMTSRLLDIVDAELYVGYVDGAPVASSALVATHRTGGVYNVGCVASQRRKGYGEAMTWHAVRRGAEMGCLMSSLQASEMGRPVYERMGFRLVAPYRTYLRPEHTS